MAVIASANIEEQLVRMKHHHCHDDSDDHNHLIFSFGNRGPPPPQGKRPLKFLFLLIFSPDLCGGNTYTFQLP